MGFLTPLYDLHIKAKGKMVDFAGWHLPLHYGSQIHEHQAVRQKAGVFDISHMGIIDLKGKDAASLLQRLIANDSNRLLPGKALYSCMLNEQGGVIDDLIVYQIAADYYRLVVNASTCNKDVGWIKENSKSYPQIDIIKRKDLGMLALQGPETFSILSHLFPEDICELKKLHYFAFTKLQNVMIAHTGYTGEKGVEIIAPASDLPNLWLDLIAAGALPCGLGARDTLRLEAGYNLNGAEMDEEITPLESNLAWTVQFEPTNRQFIGRIALEQQKQVGIKRHLVGVILNAPGMMRAEQALLVDGEIAGKITSASYSPTLQKSIALARVANTIPLGQSCAIAIRQNLVAAQVVKPQFVRHGKIMVEA